MATRARIFWRCTACLGAALLILGGVLFTFREPLLRRLAEHTIEKNSGLRVEIGELRSTLGSGAFEARNLAVYNLKEFGGSLLARIPLLLVDLDTESATRGILHLRKLHLHMAELHVLKTKDGQLNVDGVEKTVREQITKRFRRRRQETAEFQFGGIDELELTLRQVRYTDLARPGRTREVDLRLEKEVTTLKTQEELQTWLGAVLFRIIVQQSLHKSPTNSAPQPPPPQPQPAGP